ncbi:hypothetical protein [Streptomyces sp. NPDC059009]|uniref:hypothetical protein n=1 Tax=Streptomyces sp. NPDC059009 TaxID=3346694 RepID=UPI0036C41B3D
MNAKPVTLTVQDKNTLRTAAWGAVSLMSAAGAAGSAHKVGTHGSIALTSATGLVGHVLAERGKIKDLNGRSVAELADHVLPALTATMTLLTQQDPAEADNFRSTITVVIEASNRAQKGGVSPAMADMARKITEALNS